jgi:hypothetical protein
MTKWFIPRGFRGKFCGTCHSSESQWPSTMKAGGGREFYHGLMSKAYDAEPPTTRSCGHKCCSQTIYFAHPTMNRENNRCCACRGGCSPCSVCVPNTLESIFRGNGLTDRDAREVAQSVLEDVAGNRFTVPETVAQSRKARLEMNVRRLYHQTSEEGARSILRSQEFHLGPNGLAGPGIYFTDNPGDTHRKARKHGAILQADVFLGRVKHIPAGGDRSITLENLLADGYDSVEIPRNGVEYVVYCHDQAINITLMNERGCQVPGCRSCQGSQRHYCKVCHDNNSDHRARDCSQRNRSSRSSRK